MKNIDREPSQPDELLCAHELCIPGDTLEQVKAKAVFLALVHNGGHQRSTAACLDISLRGLRNFIYKYEELKIWRNAVKRKGNYKKKLAPRKVFLHGE